MRELLKSKGSLFPENSLEDSRNEHSSRKAHTRMNTINFAVQIYSSIQLWPDFVINFFFFQ